MSDYIKVGGYNLKDRGAIVEYLPSDDGSELIDIEISLPPSAFKLKLKAENCPSKHPDLIDLWDDLLSYKDHSQKPDTYIKELNKAIQEWDTDKVALLTHWFFTIAEYKKAPTKSVMTMLGDDFEGQPLKNGVADIISTLITLMKKNGRIPLKAEIRAEYTGKALDVDKAINNAGLKWLENKTRLNR